MKAVQAGGEELVICRVDDEVFALQNECPHAGGPLAQGALHGYRIVCPYHAWEFDCRTGEFDRNSDVRLRRYTAGVSDGEVYVEVD